MHSAPHKIRSRRDPQDRRPTPPLRSKLASNAPRQNRTEPNDHTSKNRGRASKLGIREKGGRSRSPELEEFSHEFSSTPIFWPNNEFASESRHDLTTYDANMFTKDSSFRTSSPAIDEGTPRTLSRALQDDCAFNYFSTPSPYSASSSYPLPDFLLAPVSYYAPPDTSRETDFSPFLGEILGRDVGAPSEQEKSGGLQEGPLSSGKGRDPQALPGLEKRKNDE